MKKEMKLRSGRYMINCIGTVTDDRMFLEFPYDPTLMADVKMMEGRKYHGYDKVNPRKVWSFPITQRNTFRLSFLLDPKGVGPYKPFLEEPVRQVYRTFHDHFKDVDVELFEHQKHLANCWLHKKVLEAGFEMRTGKTLATFAALEHIKALHNDLDENDIIWLGTNSSLGSTSVELDRWRPLVKPGRRMTYEAFRKLAESGEIKKLPRVLVCDESSRIKTPTSKRSQAVKLITDAMRDDLDWFYILNLTGTPAPKTPTDWWHQIEVLQPGYLIEPNEGALQRRLSLIETLPSPTGQVFPKLLAWLDNPDVCGHFDSIDTGQKDDNDRPVKMTKYCGKLKSDPVHGSGGDVFNAGDFHSFVPTINEVAKLYRRMKGIVEIKFAKDCLKLPPPETNLIALKASESTIRAAKFIVNSAPKAIVAVSLLRELSDGFQYVDEPNGIFEPCKCCGGSKKVVGTEIDSITPLEQECAVCNKDGLVEGVRRAARRFETPKLDRLKLDLESQEEHGRIVVFAAFTESIDMVVETCIAEGWNVIRADGRGYTLFDKTGEQITGYKKDDLLKIFNRYVKGTPEQVAFVGFPDATGIDLSAASLLIWYSLTNSGENFRQAGARILGPGMDKDRGANYNVYLHLPSDKKIFDKLLRKVELEALTMGELKEALDE